MHNQKTRRLTPNHIRLKAHAFGRPVRSHYKNHSHMTNELSKLEQLCYSTTLIECETKEGDRVTGTGFFFSFFHDSDRCFPVVITNKHVVKGMTTGCFRLTESDKNGNPINNRHFLVKLSNDFQNKWLFHPDTNVDLCIMPIAPIITAAKRIEKQFFFRTYDKRQLPDKQHLDELDVVEEILMIGYPIGIMDSRNNMPIVRRGTTATHPNIDYNGAKEFLIDAACFPGSSGSPVVVYDKNGYTTRLGDFKAGESRLLFLGVLYAGPQFTAIGDIEIVTVPIAQKPIAISRIPNNLGIVIKSERLLDFEDVILKTNPR